MSILGRIKTAFAPKAAIMSSDLRVGDSVWESFTGGAANGAPSEQAILSLTAAYACTTLISGAVSSLPMHIYRREDDGDLIRDEKSDLWWMLNEEFCPRWSAASGWSFLVASKLLHGDAFAEIQRTPSGKIRGLVPIHPYRVEVIATPDGGRLIYRVGPDRTISRPASMEVRIIDQDDMLHIPGFGFNGLRGLSALKNS